MSTHEEDKHKKESMLGNLRNFFREEEEPIQEEDNSFSGMARKLREQKHEELQETKAFEHDLTDWIAGRVMDALQLTGSALGNRIHDMILGSSANDEDAV